MADNPIPDSLCYAYRELLADKVGTQANRITSFEQKLERTCNDIEGRLRSLERYQSEQIGLTRGQATLWGIGIILLSALISTFVKMFFTGGV